ncbi:hypothetical protein D3C87_1286490 [compost metagenome]
MLTKQCNQGRCADNHQHKHQTLHARNGQVTFETTDDGRDAHEAAVGVQRRDGHLAERDAEVQQRSGGTGAAQTDDVSHLMTGELAVGRSRSEHTEDHRHLRANH